MGIGLRKLCKNIKTSKLVNKMRDEITKMQNHYEKRDLHSKKEVKK